MTTIPRDARSGTPTVYRGTTFRSHLESRWARLLDRYGLVWEYEPRTFKWDDRWYLPDFHVYVPVRGEELTVPTWIEVKPESAVDLIASPAATALVPGDRVFDETDEQFMIVCGFPGGRHSEWHWMIPWAPPRPPVVPWIRPEETGCGEDVYVEVASGSVDYVGTNGECRRCVECIGRVVRAEDRGRWREVEARRRLAETERAREEAERTAGVYKIGSVTFASRAYREKHGL